jgi:hypothetical protein
VNDDFNRQYVFSLAQDRHDPTLWLFGGIWEVVGRRPEPRSYSNDVVRREDSWAHSFAGSTCAWPSKGENRRRAWKLLAT